MRPQIFRIAELAGGELTGRVRHVSHWDGGSGRYMDNNTFTPGQMPNTVSASDGKFLAVPEMPG